MGMTLLALIAVLLIEQIRPLPYGRVVQVPLQRMADTLEHYFNVGEHRYGLLAWLVAVGGLVLVAGAVFFALAALSPILGWLWNVLVLYFTLGFRQFSHHFTDIQLALRMDDLPRARKELDDWRGCATEGLSASEISRLSIEAALAASHRHVFAVLVCFVLLPGPCGAVLYFAKAYLAEEWGGRDVAPARSFGDFSQQACSVVDWFPARATAAGFAIVGNFEDAIYCWRNQLGRWANHPWGRSIGIVLASGAGALGVRLGEPISSDEGLEAAEIEVGEPADVDFMQSAVGLVWRALLLWLSLLLLMSFAGVVGG